MNTHLPLTYTVPSKLQCESVEVTLAGVVVVDVVDPGGRGGVDAGAVTPRCGVGGGGGVTDPTCDPLPDTHLPTLLSQLVPVGHCAFVC